ncbi:UNKNOWN [Stylonychia lemnae]|uniref:Uncharacterized protein n=1 Tax=Stylonychia lemnae TaxID=5949 RepID=A0A078A9P7_STYLE|nr:UNKNOWN [Stylonychia lemnae]|eukprot:CDW78606.1 UNKNOWN [Stylonychia lemnae]
MSQKSLDEIYNAPAVAHDSQVSLKSSNENEPAPSKVQQLISEIFRICLCRNDDYNLVISSLSKKNQKKKSENKEKLIKDLRNREEDRQSREADIIKDLQPVNKNYQSIDKHLRKMIRKTLLLTLDPIPQQQKEQVQSVLQENYPSYLHLASIMNERTQDEKDTFGKVKLSEIKVGRHNSQFFTEEKVDALIETYITCLKLPYELILKTIDRSRDRFIREFAKFEAFFEQAKFFTEDGVKDRKEKVKLKVFMSQVYGAQNIQENKTKGAIEMYQNIPLQDQALRMLQVHNSKVEKILKGFRTQYEIRKTGGQADPSVMSKDNDDEEDSSSADQMQLPNQKPKKSGLSKIKKNVKSKKDVGVIIQMKGQDGNLQTYEESKDKSRSSSRSEKENKTEIKDKKIKKKTTSKGVIQSEQTLEMLKNVLGSKKSVKTAKESSSKNDVQIYDDENEDGKNVVLKPKPKTVDKKPAKKVVKKKPQDTMTKFIDNFGESPHLQAIEDSYLKFLEAQYAKESHLREVKKFQIMYALKKIQRFWKVKYQQIRNYCAMRIQRTARNFIQSLRIRALKLYKIRKSLLFLKLQSALILFAKYNRVKKSQINSQALKSINQSKIIKIQGMIRTRIAKKRVKFMILLRKLRIKQFFIRNLRSQGLINREIRDKETYYVQRYALAKVEIDSIMKYIQKAEDKFESNWLDYESQLEKYLTQNKQYKDWAQKKDDCGNVYWINLKTLKEQKEHPGKTIFFANKKILKAKADEELKENFRPIYERRIRILETIFDIKSKIQNENHQRRREILFSEQTNQ